MMNLFTFRRLSFYRTIFAFLSSCGLSNKVAQKGFSQKPTRRSKQLQNHSKTISNDSPFQWKLTYLKPQENDEGQLESIVLPSSFNNDVKLLLSKRVLTPNLKKNCVMYRYYFRPLCTRVFKLEQVLFHPLRPCELKIVLKNENGRHYLQPIPIVSNTTTTDIPDDLTKIDKDILCGWKEIKCDFITFSSQMVYLKEMIAYEQIWKQ